MEMTEGYEMVDCGLGDCGQKIQRIVVRSNTIDKALAFATNLLEKVRVEDIPKATYAKLMRKKAEIRLRAGGSTDENNLLFYKALSNKRIRIDEKYGIFKWETKYGDIFATDAQISGLYLEYLAGAFELYYGDMKFEGKRMLDIGGYVGETAMYFLSKGAASATIYEPVVENVASMRMNLSRYGENVKIFEKAVGKKECEITIKSDAPPGTVAFGMSVGKHVRTYACAGISEILADGKYDIAKIDCEGCETCLIGVEKEKLRSIPLWVVEAHSDAIKSSVIEKFILADFIFEREIVVATGVTILYFNLKK